MRSWLKNISIRNKLIMVILSVSIIAILFSFLSYFIYSSQRDKTNLFNQMNITAKLIGDYAVSPLVFGDNSGANEILDRINSLKDVNAGYILDTEGNIFASYQKDTLGREKDFSRQVVTTADDISILEDDSFRLVQPITHKGDKLGAIYLIVSLKPLRQQLIADLKPLLINMLLVLLLSYLLTLMIQRFISKPIKELVRTTDRLTLGGDYTIRLEQDRKDEIGKLYASYNEMLNRISKEQHRQKQYSQALKISEQNYRSIFENSIVGIFNLDWKSGELIQANDRFYQILKVDASQKETFTVDDFLEKETKINLMKNIKAGGSLENFEFAYDQDTWISFSGKIVDSQKRIDGVIQDITDRKKNMMELRKVNFELDNFVYHASHDLRSPLRSVLGLTNILKIESEDDNTVHIAERIESSVSRLDDLVTDLLTFSKNSRTDKDLIEIDIDELIQESLDVIPQAILHDIKINKKIQKNKVLIGDKLRLSVILNNLLVNACKYHDREKDLLFINILVEVTKDKCRMIVEDNGTGISEENQERIFDMFFRASESSEGSGLGLYIVKNIVDTLDGRLFMTSVPKEGTTFEVIIPNHSRKIMSRKKRA